MAVNRNKDMFLCVGQVVVTHLIDGVTGINEFNL